MVQVRSLFAVGILFQNFQTLWLRGSEHASNTRISCQKEGCFVHSSINYWNTSNTSHNISQRFSVLKLLINPRDASLTLIMRIHSLRLWPSKRLCPCSLEGCFDPMTFHGCARWVVLGVGKQRAQVSNSREIYRPNQTAISRRNRSSPCFKEILLAVHRSILIIGLQAILYFSMLLS